MGLFLSVSLKAKLVNEGVTMEGNTNDCFEGVRSATLNLVYIKPGDWECCEIS